MNTPAASSRINVVRTFTDETTGREIRQLTDFEHGAHLGYFRDFRQLPDGRILAWSRHAEGRLILIEPESGDIERIPFRDSILKLRESDGRAWFIRFAPQPWPAGRAQYGSGRELWRIDLPGGQAERVCAISDEVPGLIEDITIDGRQLLSVHREQDLAAFPIPTTKDVESVNRYLKRPRRGELWVTDTVTGQTRKILETEGLCPSHLDTSPADPGLLRFCQDMPETQGQRIWTIRVDGSGRTPIRPQARGEMITHEFWWSDPRLIGFTYQDRRADPTVATHHWAEYALASTRLGLADLAGREIYLSDPLNSYHTHLFRSPDGRFVSGEGTDGNSFVYAAAISLDQPRLDMIRLASIHTAYVPFRGQGVDCNFSADGRWLIYADKLQGPDKPHQLFAVKVDL